MPRLELAEFRLDGVADLHHVRASSRKAAAGRWIGRAGNLTLQDDPLLLLFYFGIWDECRRPQRLGVGVQWVAGQVQAAGQLDDLTQVHHRDTVTDIAYHG